MRLWHGKILDIAAAQANRDPPKAKRHTGRAVRPKGDNQVRHFDARIVRRCASSQGIDEGQGNLQTSDYFTVGFVDGDCIAMQKMRRVADRADAQEPLARIRTGKAIKHYRPGEIVFSQGDPANDIFFVQSGRVKASIVSRRGREALLAIVRKGEFFGVSCLNRLTPRPCTTTAMTECTLVSIGRAAMKRALRDDPQFSELFLSYLIERGLRIQEQLSAHLLDSTERRLARLLLRLANLGGDGREPPIIEDVSQEMLAAMVGTTRTRINHFMTKFRRLGLVDYRKENLVIHGSLTDFVLND